MENNKNTIIGSEDKETGIVTLFRGNNPVNCPFRSPIIVPINNKIATPGGQQLQLIQSQCNSLCPLLEIKNIQDITKNVIHKERRIAVLNCAKHEIEYAIIDEKKPEKSGLLIH